MWKQIFFGCGFVCYVIAVTKLCLFWFDLQTSFLIAIGSFLGICIIMLVASALLERVREHRPLHTRILTPIRMWATFSLASVVVDCWHTHLKIHKNRNATVLSDVEGRVNFGRNRWIECYIHTLVPQKTVADGFKITINDEFRHRTVEPDIVVDEPTFKKYRIKFGGVLARKRQFHYKIRYRLEKNFVFDRKDHWYHVARRPEKKVIISVDFPKSYRIRDYDGDTISEFGEYNPFPRKPEEQPRRISDHELEWTVDTVLNGMKQELSWELEKA